MALVNVTVTDPYDRVVTGLEPDDFRFFENNVEQEIQRTWSRRHTQAFRFFAGFRGGDVRAWLMQIVRTTCYTWLRANRPLQEATECDENLFPTDSRTPNPEEVVLQHDSGTLLRKALEMLPPIFGKS